MNLSAPSPRTLLMLDYDGTLTPIVPNYELAYISQSHIATLEQLIAEPDLQLAIVSGRSVEQLMVFLKELEDEPIYMVGLHGGQIFDMKQDKFLLSPDPRYMEAIRDLARAVAHNPVFSRPGIQIENKAFTLGVHYRQASPENGEAAIATLLELYQSMELEEDFLLKPGKQLVEVVPRTFNKGTGVENLIKIVADETEAALKLIFMGDDVTDFDAFRVVNALGGASYYVGPNLPATAPSVAGCLDSVSDVYRFLEKYFLKPKVSQ